MWRWAAGAFLLCALPALIPLLRSDIPGRIAAAQFVVITLTFSLVCLAFASGHDYFWDVAFAQAIAGIGGGLVFIHAMERWL